MHVLLTSDYSVLLWFWVFLRVGSAGLDIHGVGEFNNSVHFISILLEVLPPILGTRGEFWNTSAKILLYFWSYFLTQQFSSNLQSFSIVSFSAITLIVADASQKPTMKFLACYANNKFLVAHIWNCLQEYHVESLEELTFNVAKVTLPWNAPTDQ